MAQLIPQNVAYLYDGSFVGLLCALFEAYQRQELPAVVQEEDGAQLAFGQLTRRIETEGGKAKRVEQGILRTIGGTAYQQVWTAFLSCQPEKSLAIFRYLVLGFSIGRNIYHHLAHDDVLAVDKICRLINGEAHHFKMFARFAQMEGGVFFSRIEPENHVLPLIMPHFSDRFSVQPFLIHDPVHGCAGVFDRQSWHLVETDSLDLPQAADEEYEFRQLWRQFYQSVAVMERFNAKCRQGFMPKKFWRNMTEMNHHDRIDAQRPRKFESIRRL